MTKLLKSGVNNAPNKGMRWNAGHRGAWSCDCLLQAEKGPPGGVESTLASVQKLLVSRAMDEGKVAKKWYRFQGIS